MSKSVRAGKRKADVLSDGDGNSAPNTPVKAKKKILARVVTTDRLSVFNLDSRVLGKTVGEWLNGNAPGSGVNASLPGRLDVVGESVLKFKIPEVEKFGPCWSYSTRTKTSNGVGTALKLLEGGDNKDAPRWQFDKRKHYIYHMMALYSAQRAEAIAMSSTMAAAPAIGSVSGGTPTARLNLPAQLRYTIADLEGVSATKVKSGAYTVLHLCGNKWCCFSGHYFVGSKVYNDEQTACHKGLHNARSLEEYLQIQNSYCKHEPKCWALPYGGAYDLTPEFCETGQEIAESSDDYGSTSDLEDLALAGSFDNI